MLRCINSIVMYLSYAGGEMQKGASRCAQRGRIPPREFV